MMLVAKVIANICSLRATSFDRDLSRLDDLAPPRAHSRDDDQRFQAMVITVSR